jgi:hypothetical protein
MLQFVTHKSQQVAGWAASKMGARVIEPFYALGVEDEFGDPKGAFIFSEFTRHNVELTVYAPGALKRHIVRGVFSYAFNQLGVDRITVRCPAAKKELNELQEHLGFKFEGILRRFYGDDDCFIYGMLRSECRFLPKDN